MLNALQPFVAGHSKPRRVFVSLLAKFIPTHRDVKTPSSSLWPLWPNRRHRRPSCLRVFVVRIRRRRGLLRRRLCGSALKFNRRGRGGTQRYIDRRICVWCLMPDAKCQMPDAWCPSVGHRRLLKTPSRLGVFMLLWQKSVVVVIVLVIVVSVTAVSSVALR